MSNPTYSAPIPCGNGAILGLVTSRKKGVMRMSDFTTRVADILTEQCGHESEWMPADRQILDLAVEADERESDLRAEIERLRTELLGIRAYFLETDNMKAVAKVDKALANHEQGKK